MRLPESFTVGMGKRLAAVRADSGMTPAQFAASVDAVEPNYLAWETVSRKCRCSC